jgi:Uma2 family endonuclease
MAAPTLLEPRAASPRLMTEEALYEVVNGQRVELPPMSVYASWISSRFQQHLGPYAEARRLGTVVTETLFILDPGGNLRRRPDVAFVSAERWPLDRPIPEIGDWEVVPDLAVEVISPNDAFEDVLAKMHEYFEKGVRQVWIVVPKTQQIYMFDSPTRVHIWSVTEELDGGQLLPGLRLPVAHLFQRQTAAGTAAQG